MERVVRRALAAQPDQTPRNSNQQHFANRVEDKSLLQIDRRRNKSTENGVEKKRHRHQYDDVDQITPPTRSASSFRSPDLAFGHSRKVITSAKDRKKNRAFQRSRREWSRRESSDIDDSPKGERAGASESIEVHADACSPESRTRKITQTVPGGNGADGSRATSTIARRASEREQANQSKCTLTRVLQSLARANYTNRSRRESNPHLRFRKPPFYPLNYGNTIRFFLAVSPVCVTLSSR